MSEQEYREALWEKCSTMHIPNTTREEIEQEEYECFIEDIKDLCKKYSKTSGIDIDWRDFTDHESLEEVEEDLKDYITWYWEH